MSAYRHAPLSIGHDYIEPPGFLRKFYDVVRHILGHYLPHLLANARRSDGIASPRKGAQRQLRSIWNLLTALILVWMLALWWGEVGIFRNSIAGCDWHYWEKWVSITQG